MKYNKLEAEVSRSLYEEKLKNLSQEDQINEMDKFLLDMAEHNKEYMYVALHKQFKMWKEFNEIKRKR